MYQNGSWRSKTFTVSPDGSNAVGPVKPGLPHEYSKKIVGSGTFGTGVAIYKSAK